MLKSINKPIFCNCLTWLYYLGHVLLKTIEHGYYSSYSIVLSTSLRS